MRSRSYPEPQIMGQKPNLRKMAGSRKETNEPRIVREVFVDILANSCEKPFNDIRQQLASGCLPNLAQHLEAVASNLRENPIHCSNKETRAKI